MRHALFQSTEAWRAGSSHLPRNLGPHEGFEHGLAFCHKSVDKHSFIAGTVREQQDMDFDINPDDSLYHVFDTLEVPPWLTGTSQQLLSEDLPDTPVTALDTLAEEIEHLPDPAGGPEGSLAVQLCLECVSNESGEVISCVLIGVSVHHAQQQVFMCQCFRTSLC